jgi:hypothetical protein
MGGVDEGAAVDIDARSCSSKSVTTVGMADRSQIVGFLLDRPARG